MRTRIIILALLGVMLTSCDKTNAPEIDFHELGMENSKAAAIGGDLHMDAEVIADNKIETIQVIIHSEAAEHKKGMSIFSSDGWEVDTTYEEFSGLRNTNFHKHLEVSEEAKEGHYHFHFKVVDMEGYETVFEEEIEITAAGK